MKKKTKKQPTFNLAIQVDLDAAAAILRGLGHAYGEGRFNFDTVLSTITHIRRRLTIVEQRVRIEKGANNA